MLEELEQLREQKKNEAAGKIGKFSKIVKEKKLKKQKEEEEERIRLEQEEEEEFNATQNIKSNPHGFDNGDIITDDYFNYEVVDNYAKKILKNNLTSETGKLEYTTIKGNLGWYKGGKAVNVSMVQAANSTPQKSLKSQWPFNFDIPEDGEIFRRYGDYLFKVENNKVDEYPSYLIDFFDDSLVKLTEKDTDYKMAHKEHKQEIQDYNATLGAGLKRNIGVSKILKSLGYEII